MKSSMRGNRDLDRKELINQLLETRGVVVRELHAHEQLSTNHRGARFHDEAGPVRLPKLDPLRRPGSSQQAALVKSIVEEVLPSNPSNMLLSFPVSQFNAKKKAPVKLPIFRLPPAVLPNAPAPSSPTNNRSMIRSPPGTAKPSSPVSRAKTAQAAPVGRKFYSYHDKRNLRKTLIVLINNLSPEEKAALTIMLRLQAGDIDRCAHHMKDRFVELASQSLSGDRTLVTDVFPVDESMSVFNTSQAKIDAQKEQAQLHRQQNQNRPSSPSQRQTAQAAANNLESLRAVSRGVNFQQVGISERFQEFLTSDRIAMLQSSPQLSHTWQSTSRGQSPNGKGRSLAPYATGGSSTGMTKQHSLPALVPPATAGSSNGNNPYRTANGKKAKKKKKDGNADNIDALLSSSDPKVLSKAFLASLLAVQKHSSLVKRSLETAQSMVTVDDSRAKDLVLMLGAERMAKVIARIIENEQQRGLLAWKMYVQQQRQVERAGRLLRSLVLRNIIVAFNNMVRRLLQQNFTLWVQFTERENQRLHRERVVLATLKIQSMMRGYLARKRVRALRQRRKYEKIYDATVKIQALFRGKLQRWRYLRLRREREEQAAASLIQRVYRGYQARRRVAQIRLRRNRQFAATLIQKIIRSRLSRMRVLRLKEEKRRNVAATKIQSLIRGFLTRQNLAKIMIDRARNHAATIIQKRVRGMITRKTIHRRVKEIQQYRDVRNKAATKIQAAYRGYRNRIMVKIRLMQHRKELRRKFQAATRINTMIRGFLARHQLQGLRIQRYQVWLTMAREWQETWSDEGNTWCYINTTTGEALWEPTRNGYTKADGRLVLYSGDIVDDPRNASPDGENGDGDGQGGNSSFQRLLALADQADSEEAKAKAAAKLKGKKGWLSSSLCSECNDRTAVRHCNDCNDDFCTKCYKSSHALGARRHHTFEPLGPKDCDECELVLAERFCVTCDENFCDKCWRQLHKHGKRVYHPYCDIDRDGKVDPRIYTMDGEELTGADGGYDATYSQFRADNLRTNQDAMSMSQQIAQYDSYGNPIDPAAETGEYYGGYGAGTVDEYGNPVEGYYDQGSTTTGASEEYGSTADGTFDLL